jgi:hypothetical protein
MSTSVLKPPLTLITLSLSPENDLQHRPINIKGHVPVRQAISKVSSNHQIISKHNKRFRPGTF